MSALRPVLFAPFADLTSLRYELPLVLSDDDAAPVRPLSSIVNELLREIAPRGPGGERLRLAVLGVEREIRRAVARGDSGTLYDLWDRAVAGADPGGEPFTPELAKARETLRADGEVVERDATLRTAMHVWRIAQRRRSRVAKARILDLITRLEDMLRADLLRSPAGRRAGALRAAFAGPFADLFDLDEMAGVLGSGWTGLSDTARERIASTLRVLREEMFFRADPAAFAFHSVHAALHAQRARTPAMAALLAAIAVAERVTRGDVDGETGAAQVDDRFFPSAFVSLRTRGDPAACEHALEALLSGVPLKILVEVDDLLGSAARLGAVAMGLGTAFVVQTTLAGLVECSAAIARAMEAPGPALLAVFTGELDPALPPYLVASAANASRAFPTFTYDPGAGASWADRFALGTHPQPDRPWPVHPLAYADEAGQRATLDVPFTFTDLALCDPRLVDRFAVVPRERWAEFAVEAVVPAVDDDGGLHRLVADDSVTELAARTADAWQRLREIDSLKRPAPVATAVPSAPPVETEALPAPIPAVAAEIRADRDADEAYIETARCSTCNECTTLNPRMFRYNENRQAYIAEIAAGTYRELVEAAETCQVAVIHPGKPRDPNEPGLAELIERAAAFA